MSSTVAYSILAIFTIILAVATVILAVATFIAAVTSKKSFELEARPYFTFAGFDLELASDDTDKGVKKTKNNAVHIGMQFKNPGRVLIEYELKDLTLELPGCERIEPETSRRSGLIFPSDLTTFWCGTFAINSSAALPLTGTVTYTSEYSGAGKSKKYSSIKRIKFSITGLDPLTFKWVYLEELED